MRESPLLMYVRPSPELLNRLRSGRPDPRLSSTFATNRPLASLRPRTAEGTYGGGEAEAEPIVLPGSMCTMTRVREVMSDGDEYSVSGAEATGTTGPSAKGSSSIIMAFRRWGGGGGGRRVEEVYCRSAGADEDADAVLADKTERPAARLRGVLTGSLGVRAYEPASDMEDVVERGLKEL